MGANPRIFPLSREQARILIEYLVQRSPRLVGLARSRWWLDGLRQRVGWLRRCSLPGVCQILKRLGVCYKRGRAYLHSPDPDYDLKLAYVQAALKLARADPARYVVLFEDELTYYRRPSVARAYAPSASDAPRVPQGYTTNKTRRIAGSLNPITGQFWAWQRHRFDVKTLLAYYRYLETVYPDAQVIFLVQDNWPVHFHPSLLLTLVGSRVCLLRLPTYAPWTNPTEKVWLRLHQELLHHHDFGDDWLGLQRAVSDWLEHCDDDPDDLLHYVGLSPC